MESFIMAVRGCLPVLKEVASHASSNSSDIDRGNNEALKRMYCKDGLNALFKLAAGNSPEAIVMREQMYEVRRSSLDQICLCRNIPKCTEMSFLISAVQVLYFVVLLFVLDRS